MQRFLGIILFCSRHIKDYVRLVAPLYEMIHKSFSWEVKTWSRDYKADFEKVKESLIKAVSLFYPDYDLDWYVDTDISERGVSAFLIQERPDASGVLSREIINSAHKKFSGSAQNWATSKKEAFGLFFGPREFEYYLRGKPFVIRTDHANLRYMEISKEPIIQRWWSYLQSFVVTIQHFKGKNHFAPDIHLSYFMHRVLILQLSKHDSIKLQNFI